MIKTIEKIVALLTAVAAVIIAVRKLIELLKPADSSK